ncbi:SseB family protein [Phytomonospora endophytica]|uniref:SseB protein N-terminal domain-containing protein n=1 Tax=Phytomonospora endophytica TaxID=714109 RepID=A0A841FZK7_9ACTN|nr:SseB family protein [Phytomonospora endophytica]MBB6038817.1 hypothetical protein [Phytomonospora endophytica]GIG68387.1 hypothetical protein Pen01_46820 [Phytomonospora endophytica]
MTDSFGPSNDLEVALCSAVDRGDLEAYLDILRGATVVLPCPNGNELGPGTSGWPVMTVDGRGYVPVFTSAEAMLANPAARDMSGVPHTLPKLARMWPEATWGLAVDPGSPIAVCVPSSYVMSTGFRLGAVDPVDALHIPDIRLDGFEEIRTGTLITDGAAEEELARAIAGGDAERALRALFAPPLFLISTEKDGYTLPGEPGFRWLTLRTKQGKAVPVFTSRNRVDLGLGPNTYTTLPTRLLDLAEAWPNDGFGIVVNPNTPLTVHLPGAGVLGLTDFADRLDLRPDTDDFRPGAEPDEALFDAAAVALALEHTPGVAIQSNEQTDHTLLAAASRGDRVAYLKILLNLNVRLPAPPDQDPGTRYAGRPFPWRTVRAGDRTVMEVFTSTYMLRGTGIRTRSGAEVPNLLRHWPDPAWDLAINPGTPLGAFLPGDRIASLSLWHDQALAHALSHHFPVDDRADLKLLDAARRGDRSGFLEMLRPAKVILVTEDRGLDWNTPPTDPRFPWDPVPLRGRPSIPVYSSRTWQERSGGSGKTVRAPFGELAAAWPEGGPDLVLNPASPISVTMTAEEVRAFAG